MRGVLALTLALGLACSRGASSPPSRAAERGAVAHALAQVDAHVAQLRRAFDDRTGEPRPTDVAWVKLRLSHLAELDQYLRTVYDDLGPESAPRDQQALQKALESRIEEVDAANTREVKTLVATHGWFRISVFGEKADHDAWLLVQHADHDPEFQRRVLETLEGLHPRGETSPGNFGLVRRICGWIFCLLDQLVRSREGIAFSA